MSLNKRGLAWETVGKWILAILIIVGLWLVFIGFGDFLYSSGSKAACQNWVYRNSVEGLKELTGNLESSPCVTTEETIKDKDVKDKNALYETLARNMYDCWDQYGRGESDFYSNFDFGSKDTYCRICSEIKFDQDVAKRLKEINIDDFEVYLSNHNPPNHKETYADFFTKAKESKLDFGQGAIPLDANKKLYTSFVVYKSSLSPRISPDIAFSAGGCITVAGAVSIVGTPIAGVGVGGWCLIGMAAGHIYRYLGYADYLYPSLILFKESDKKLSDMCSYVYYNPENKPLSFIKK